MKKHEDYQKDCFMKLVRLESQDNSPVSMNMSGTLPNYFYRKIWYSGTSMHASDFCQARPPGKPPHQRRATAMLPLLLPHSIMWNHGLTLLGGSVLHCQNCPVYLLPANKHDNGCCTIFLLELIWLYREIICVSLAKFWANSVFSRFNIGGNYFFFQALHDAIAGL